LVETVEIVPEEAALLRAMSESHFFDVKSKRITPAKLSRTLSALGNADGGEVLIGIEDKSVNFGNRWQGFADEEEANATVDVLTRLFPPGETFQYRFLRCESETGLVLQCEIIKNAQIWPDTAGEIYVRRGAQNLRLQDRDAIRRLEFAKGLTSFEDQKLESDSGVLLESDTMQSFMRDVVPASEPEPWLRKQRLPVFSWCLGMRSSPSRKRALRNIYKPTMKLIMQKPEK